MSEQNQNPNPETTPAPAPAPEAAPAAEVTPVVEDLKPLTEAEMESMSTADITAHAEKFEAQVKAAKQQTPDEIRANQIIRAKKAQEKALGQTTAPADTETPQAEKQLATADVLTLAKSDFELGSPEQILLQERVEQGIIKSYAEGLTHVGVSAELAAMTADKNATAVIDENDTSENQLKTKKEAVAQARATGEIPDDPSVQKAIVEDNISRMSSLN